MNHNFKMIVFILILGSITSILLVGANLLTSERILNNQAIKLRTTILNANGLTPALNDVNDIFLDRVEEIEIDDLTFYHDTITGNVSYIFEGGGVWGPIIGVITLAPDFETIVSIAILQQEETPGLGGVVAEKNYLKNYVGVKMIPEILVVKTASAPNEADAITGATRTSNAFQDILNTSYQLHKTAWESYTGGNAS